MRLKRRSSSTSSSGVTASPAIYGLDGFPAFDPETLPGETIAERGEAYVESLDLEPSPLRAALLFRVECLIDDFERKRGARPSFDEQVLSDLKEGV